MGAPPVSTARPRRQRQRGEIMLITLVALLVCLIGLIYAMRETIITTLVSGNNLAKQKDVQANDVALRMVEDLVTAAYNGQALELSAGNELWFRDVQPTSVPPPAPPSAAYWATCVGGGVTTRCAELALPAGVQPVGSVARVVVQPTGRTDATICGLSLLAIYYDVYIYVQEPSLATFATTHTVFKLCALP